MGLRLITGPTGYPITLAEAKLQVRVASTETSEDDLLNAYISAATAWVEKHLQRAILTQTWELVLDDFSDAMEIPLAPVQSITSITYYDENDALQTLSTSSYLLDNVGDPTWVVRAADATWPTVASGINNVIIRFVAGYTDVPESITLALRFLAANWFDNRSSADVPPIVLSLLANYRLQPL
jgi:uncharacterized phiE125 gp8 family phage protein